MFEDYLRKSIAAFKAPLRNPAENTAVEEHFQQINAIRYCKKCKYLRVCKPPVIPDGNILISQYKN